MLGRKMSPRALARTLKRMGITVKEIPDATEVTIRTGTEIIVIEEPKIQVMKMQGEEIFQITGKTVRKPLVVEERIEIPEEDVKLVAEQVGCSLEEAEKALIESKGDIAEAIIRLRAEKK